jgi:hypothetical protein
MRDSEEWQDHEVKVGETSLLHFGPEFVQERVHLLVELKLSAIFDEGCEDFTVHGACALPRVSRVSLV